MSGGDGAPGISSENHRQTLCLCVLAVSNQWEMDSEGRGRGGECEGGVSLHSVTREQESLAGGDLGCSAPADTFTSQLYENTLVGTSSYLKGGSTRTVQI